MAPRAEKSSLKRGRASVGEEYEPKKPRRSERISSQAQTTPISNRSYLPSPMTHKESTITNAFEKEGTATPPEGRPSQIRHHSPISSQPFSSPPSDTQPLSQFVYPPQDTAKHIEDEEVEGVWGYLLPLDTRFGEKLVLKKRNACPAPIDGLAVASACARPVKTKGDPAKSEEDYEKTKVKRGFPAGGYLIGRHPECDLMVDIPTISNRHCLIFNEHRKGNSIAVLEDLSQNGTFVNEAIVGRNQRRELEDSDEVTVLDEARFLFKYPVSRDDTNGFRQQFRILQQLGKGHFASVYLAIEKSSGFRYAVKRFERRHGESQRSQTEGLQQEIAVLMSVSHPNVLCLKDTFDEPDAVYLILELAPEGELFNWIVMKQKLSEAETRKVFLQLFQGIKYLHERNIVHRDIKPENILLTDKNLSVKLADFGLAKIIGEESFTTTLCGTPSYVAPEILENTRHRKYTRAVDVWSLGVVLYICLCGFPPFSDELYTHQNPFSLAEQIKMGRFDYPSPYWDTVGDPALDLIDRMLTVDVEKRITIDECLEHPWVRGTANSVSLTDSTDGLTGAMGQLDFSKRKVQRERTLLSSINDIRVSKVVEAPSNKGDGHDAKVKVWEKNPDGKVNHKYSQPQPAGAKPNTKKRIAQNKKGVKKEEAPAANRQQEEFMEMGGKGDPVLFGDDGNSRYLPDEVPNKVKAVNGAK